METHLFWGQVIKGQGHEARKTVPAWVFAYLRLLDSSSSVYYSYGLRCCFTNFWSSSTEYHYNLSGRLMIIISLSKLWW